MRRPRLTSAVLLTASSLACSLATVAHADDTHYQNVVLGERALGMGGAYTGIADDVSGAFYNPAGPAVAPSSASLSMSVYGWERRKIERGYVANLDGQLVATDFETSGLSTLPTTAGLVKKFGPRLADGAQRFAIGFATLLTSVDQGSDTHVLEGPVSRGSATVSESDRTLAVGPFFGARINTRLAVGVALAYTSRSVRRERRTASETELPDGTSSALRLEHETVSYTSGELDARLGARFDVVPELSLGLTIGLPSLAHLSGSGKITDETALADLSAAPGIAVYDPKSRGGLETANPQPLELRAGVAWRAAPRVELALDLSLHLPTEYDPVALPEPGDDVPSVDLAHVATVERKLTVNANVGGEVWVGPVPLRFGLFTNRSSAPAVTTSASNQLAHVDRYGITLSVGYNAGDYDISFGTLYSIGVGEAVSYQPAAAAAFVPTDVREDLILFYITGARKALTRAVKKLV